MNPSDTPVPLPACINHARLTDFVDFVLAVRKIQTLFRATLDPRSRREMERMEVELDARAGYLAADLAAAAGQPVQPVVLPEGGVN